MPFLGDLDEFISYWAKLYSKEKDEVQEVAQTVLDFTGGHFYPFVTITDDIFKRGEWSADSVERFLQSEAYFKDRVHLEIVNRCFSLFDNSVIVEEVRQLFLGIQRDSYFLDDLCLWNDTDKCFYSPLLHKHLFQLCCKKQSDNNNLAHSREDDKRLFTFVKEENALYWGSKVHKPNVMLRLRPPISRFHTFVRRFLR